MLPSTTNRKPADSEREVQRRTVAYAISLGLFAKPFHTPGEVGPPDYIFVCQYNWVFWIEFKKPGVWKPRPEQDRYQEKMRLRGARVYRVVNDEHWGRAVIDHEVKVAAEEANWQALENVPVPEMYTPPQEWLVNPKAGWPGVPC